MIAEPYRVFNYYLFQCMAQSVAFVKWVAQFTASSYKKSVHILSKTWNATGTVLIHQKCVESNRKSRGSTVYCTFYSTYIKKKWPGWGGGRVEALKETSTLCCTFIIVGQGSIPF